MTLNGLELEVRKYGKEENFLIDAKDTDKVTIFIEEDIKLNLDEASFNELMEKINEAYKLRQM
ncbi:hypothetical protein EHZ13_01935 [Clostridium perfringens]|uniref:hypothetical protein n=1 Tax=Clostridium perfringens TaxID=1502 RepID=UPI000F51D805|nr:hypothetical protein [Clostridium perfringens]WEV14819.1 hypothetical protein PL325_08715 [Clostridium perfringens D]EGT0690164.1 hypothetical protein [Clostridium perfringens]EHK2402061.1 hypothetical protein [Clostridium perfringens]EJT6152846.1 hypothetical protein [Clostridium perfringens]EJT6502758.1 hypothetical protein [Clostridium perfringens]